MPDTKTKRRIFQLHTSKMTLGTDVDLEEFIMAKDELTGADIKVLLGLIFRRLRLKVDFLL